MAKNEGEISEAGALKKRPRRRSPRRHAASKVWEIVREIFPRFAWLLKKAWDWTRRKPLWVRVPVYCALVVAAVVAAFGDRLLDLPLVKNVRGGIGDYVDDVFAVPLPVASGKEFAIAVARIEGDENNSVAQSLAVAIRISGVERLQIKRRLRFVDAANLDAAEADAHRTARRWLEKTHADLLLWGQVIPGGGGVRLIMTVRNAEPRQEARASVPYLAFNFLEETGTAFEEAVKTQVLGFLGQFDSSRAVAAELREAIGRLEKFVAGRREGPGRDALVFALANSEVMLGEQASDREVLAKAVGTYAQLLTARARREVPLDWAMTQNNLGNALWSLGRLEGGSQRWDEAIAAYGAALEEYSPEKYPLEWAMTQNNRGLVLAGLGRREGSAPRLDAAVQAFHDALARLDASTQRRDWAIVQNNLGNALFARGEREPGTAHLIAAIQVYKQALDATNPGRLQLTWAMIEGNLANALAAVGEREKNAATLQQAVAAYHAALKRYPADKVPGDWARTQSNLGAALGALGQLEGGTARLNEAVAALKAALLKRPRATAPLDWARTQNNLGTVLVALGEREKSLARLDEAIGCFEAAKSVPELKSSPAERVDFQNNLWRAQGIRADLAAVAAPAR